jgi:hypothetical protein
MLDKAMMDETTIDEATIRRPTIGEQWSRATLNEQTSNGGFAVDRG